MSLSFSWSDRRPIATLALTPSTHPSPLNPYAYFSSDLDATNLVAFRDRALAYAHASVENMRATNCQGFVLWDLPGKWIDADWVLQYHNSRFLPECWTQSLPVTPANSKIVLLVDEFFRILQDSGRFLSGVLVRPAEPRCNPFTGKWIGMVPHRDAETWIAHNIRFAYHRWNCRLFYIDSPGRLNYDNLMSHLPEDCLLIPERTPNAFSLEQPKYEAGLPWHKWLHGDARKINSEYAGFVSFDHGYAAGNSFSDDEIKIRFTAAAQTKDIVSFYGWYLSRAQRLYRQWLNEQNPT